MLLQKIETLKPAVQAIKSVSEQVWSHTKTMPWATAHVVRERGWSLLNTKSRVSSSRQIWKQQERKGTVSVTWEEFGYCLAEATLALQNIRVTKEDGTNVVGVQPGDHVAILGEAGDESFEWAILGTAIEAMGAVCVPLGSQETPELLAHVVNDSVPVAVLVQNDKLAKSMLNYSLVKRGELPTYTFCDMLQHLPDFRVSKDCANHPSMFREEASAEYARQQSLFTTDGAVLPFKPTDACTLIYTSGSTSLPKGAVISHGAVAFSCFALAQRGFDFGPQDLFMHDLTFSHIYGKANGLALSLYHAVKSCYGSVFTLVTDLPLYMPTVLMGVPRIWNRTRVNVEQRANHQVFAKLAKTPAEAKWQEKLKIKFDNLGTLFSYAFGQKNFFKALSGIGMAAAIGWALKQKEGIGLKLAKPIYSSIRKKAGYGECRMIVSGSAAIPIESVDFYERLGLPLREGYGATETCGGILANTLDDYKLGSLGKPIPGVEVQIRPCPGFETNPKEGGLWVRGPFLFSGYFRNEAKTKECFDEAGWFYTKDIVRVDDDGFYWFLGRDEDMKKLDTGMWFSVSKIATALEANDIVFAAVACGENKPCVGALIFIDQDMARSIAGKAPAEVDPLQYWAKHPDVMEAVKQAVAKTNKELKTGSDSKEWEQIRRFVIVPVQPTPKNGLMTGSFKIKGNVVMKQFPELLTELYAPK